LSKVNLNILTDDIWRLTEILSIHIIPGKLEHKDLLKRCKPDRHEATLIAVDSSPVDVNLSDGIKFGGSTVLSTDTSARNGIINTINRVIMPTPHNPLVAAS
jgi:uncharacterized surface protein with fasciclin (FAS1) repeats